MRATITGINGFLGSALNKRLTELKWNISPILNPKSDYVFLFGSPSSDHWFEGALSYSIRETVENFLNAVDFCIKYKIKLIYPSSGTVYEGTTAYAKTKRVLDILASIYRKEILGLRIFACYGEGEGHKGEYASIIYKFCKDMKENNNPVIWGNGEQTRDFIYIDDVIDNILRLKDRNGVVDIGTGVNYSFNTVVKMINEELKTNIVPYHTSKSDCYVDKTICGHPCEFKVTLKEGIRKVINSL